MFLAKSPIMQADSLVKGASNGMSGDLGSSPVLVSHFLRDLQQITLPWDKLSPGKGKELLFYLKADSPLSQSFSTF